VSDVTPGGAGQPREQASERAFLAHETATPWETDVPGEGDSAAIRWRTLVSADRTPSSGVAMGVLELPPGSQLAPHRHAPQEVYYVVAGEGDVFLDGAWRPARAGDVAYFPAAAVHGARNFGDGEFRIVWIFPADDYAAIVYEDAAPGGASGT
jgi:quercetin dioxygenase-like cupin family protein